MYREILFRARHEHFNELVCGSLLTTLDNKKAYIVLREEMTDNIVHIPVIEETVEQYTNTQDTLGNKVFEGDFLIAMDEDGDYYLQLVGFGEEQKDFSPMLVGFKIIQGISLDLYFEDNKWKGKHAYLLEKYGIKVERNIGEYDDWIEYQVIGNKTETPELMKLLEVK